MKNNAVIYDCQGAYYAGIEDEPLTDMKKMGYNIINTKVNLMLNTVSFEVEKIIEPLPPYLSKGADKIVKINPDVFKNFEIKEGQFLKQMKNN